MQNNNILHISSLKNNILAYLRCYSNDYERFLTIFISYYPKTVKNMHYTASNMLESMATTLGCHFSEIENGLSEVGQILSIFFHFNTF